MSQGFIRFADLVLGTTLCLLLTLLRRLSDPLRKKSGGPQKILFIKLIEQGATVVAHGAVERAAARVGRDNVYFCVFTENRAIVDIMELVPEQNVLEMRHGNLVVFAFDFLRTLVRCRRLGIDATIDMEFMARAPAVLAFLCGARIRVGLHRFTAEAPYRGDLMTHRVQYNPYLHTAEGYVQLVEALDAPAGQWPLLKLPVERLQTTPARFVARAEEIERVRARLEGEAGAPRTGPLVLLNPNAGDLLPLRRWPTERFIELAHRLLEESPDLTVVVTGAPSEKQAAEAVARQMGKAPRVFSMAGKTSLRELLVLYGVADVLVTNDSGPGHFASLTDVHNIVLFGPETPALFGPRGGRPHVIWAGLACTPCVSVFNHRRSPCTDNVCMQSIPTARVLAEVRTCLGAAVAPAGGMTGSGLPGTLETAPEESAS